MRRGGRSSAPRLRRSRDISAVIGTGTRLRSRRVIVFTSPEAAADQPSRAAFVAGRRTGNAVRRNRAKRVLREAWRQLAPRVRPGHAFVLVARQPTAGARTQDLMTDIETVLTRAGLMGR